MMRKIVAGSHLLLSNLFEQTKNSKWWWEVIDQKQNEKNPLLSAKKKGEAIYSEKNDPPISLLKKK